MNCKDVVGLCKPIFLCPQESSLRKVAVGVPFQGSKRRREILFWASGGVQSPPEAPLFKRLIFNSCLFRVQYYEALYDEDESLKGNRTAAICVHLLGVRSETNVCKFSGHFFVQNFQKNGEYLDI